MAEAPVVYPEPDATHEEVLADYGLFRSTLDDLLRHLGIKLKVMKVGGYEIDLHRLYKEVTRLGGVDVVCLQKQWVTVCQPFCFPSTFTNKSHMMKNQYLTTLYDYEQVYLHRCKVRPQKCSPAALLPEAKVPLRTPLPSPAFPPSISFISPSTPSSAPSTPGRGLMAGMQANLGMPHNIGNSSANVTLMPVVSAPEKKDAAAMPVSDGSCSGCSGGEPNRLEAPGPVYKPALGASFSGTVVNTFGKGYVLFLDFGNGNVMQGVMYAHVGSSPAQPSTSKLSGAELGTMAESSPRAELPAQPSVSPACSTPSAAPCQSASPWSSCPSDKNALPPFPESRPQQPAGFAPGSPSSNKRPRSSSSSDGSLGGSAAPALTPPAMQPLAPLPPPKSCSPLFFLASSLTVKQVRTYEPEGTLAEATVKLATKMWPVMTPAQREPFIRMAIASQSKGLPVVSCKAPSPNTAAAYQAPIGQANGAAQKGGSPPDEPLSSASSQLDTMMYTFPSEPKSDMSMCVMPALPAVRVASEPSSAVFSAFASRGFESLLGSGSCDKADVGEGFPNYEEDGVDIDMSLLGGNTTDQNSFHQVGQNTTDGALVSPYLHHEYKSMPGDDSELWEVALDLLQGDDKSGPHNDLDNFGTDSVSGEEVLFAENIFD